MIVYESAKMWTDRDTTEENVYDFNKRMDGNGPYATANHNGGNMDHLDPNLPHGAQDSGRGGGGCCASTSSMSPGARRCASRGSACSSTTLCPARRAATL